MTLQISTRAAYLLMQMAYWADKDEGVCLSKVILQAYWTAFQNDDDWTVPNPTSTVYCRTRVNLCLTDIRRLIALYAHRDLKPDERLRTLLDEIIEVEYQIVAKARYKRIRSKQVGAVEVALLEENYRQIYGHQIRPWWQDR